MTLIKSEATIQSEIMLAVSRAGHTVWRTNSGKIKDARTGNWVMLMNPGHPDLTGFRSWDGKLFVIEVKNENGRLSKVQKTFAEFAGNQPILYGVAKSASEALDIIENR